MDTTPTVIVSGKTGWGSRLYPMHPRGIRLSGEKMAASLAVFLCKFSKGLLLIIVNNNLGGNSIPFKNQRQSFMSMLLQPHRMYARTTILSTVGLGILILTNGHNTNRHCVRKNRVGKPLISHASKGNKAQW